MHALQMDLWEFVKYGSTDISQTAPMDMKFLTNLDEKEKNEHYVVYLFLHFELNHKLFNLLYVLGFLVVIKVFLQALQIPIQYRLKNLFLQCNFLKSQRQITKYFSWC